MSHITVLVIYNILDKKIHVYNIQNKKVNYPKDVCGSMSSLGVNLFP